MLDEAICQRLLCLFGGISLYTAGSCFLAGVALDYSSLFHENFNLYLPNNSDCKSQGLTAPNDCNAAEEPAALREVTAVITRPSNAA